MKTAIVIGGAGAIGSAIARQLSANGTTVVSLDRRHEAGTDDDHAIECDLATRGSATTAVEAAVEKLGEPADALVNAAGIYHADTSRDFSWDRFDRYLAINLAGAVEACMAWHSSLPPGRAGKVVNISSAAGIRGSQDLGYAISKGGLIAATKSLARAWAPDVVVFGIAPGIIDTPMADAMSGERRAGIVNRTIAKREGTPDDVASLATYLLLERTTYLTGHVIAIDGGLTL